VDARVEGLEPRRRPLKLSGAESLIELSNEHVNKFKLFGSITIREVVTHRDQQVMGFVPFHPVFQMCDKLIGQGRDILLGVMNSVEGVLHSDDVGWHVSPMEHMDEQRFLVLLLRFWVDLLEARLPDELQLTILLSRLLVPVVLSLVEHRFEPYLSKDLSVHG